MKCKVSSGLLLTACAAMAQTLSFEVASVKAAEPVNAKSKLESNLRAGSPVDGLRVDLAFISLADIVRQAYRLKSYQVTGPEWMSAERYDIHARMPDGSTPEQVPEMLQSLLADRFKLSFHRENKEHQVLALVVGKGGSKLKEVEPDSPAPAPTGEKAVPKMAVFGGSLRLDRKMTIPALCEFLGSRRIPRLKTLRSEARAWNRRMNRDRVKINWKFDRKTARRKFRYKQNFFTRSKT